MEITLVKWKTTENMEKVWKNIMMGLLKKDNL